MCLTPGRTENTFPGRKFRGDLYHVDFPSLSFRKTLITLGLDLSISSPLHLPVFQFLFLLHSLLTHVALLLLMLLFSFISFFSLTFCPSACSHLVCMVPQCLFSLLLSVLATRAQPQKTNPQLCWSPQGNIFFYFPFPMAFTFLYDPVKLNAF